MICEYSRKQHQSRYLMFSEVYLYACAYRQCWMRLQCSSRRTVWYRVKTSYCGRVTDRLQTSGIQLVQHNFRNVRPSKLQLWSSRRVRRACGEKVSRCLAIGQQKQSIGFLLRLQSPAISRKFTFANQVSLYSTAGMLILFESLRFGVILLLNVRKALVRSWNIVWRQSAKH